MGKPSQTRKQKKYLKTGDLVEVVKYIYGSSAGSVLDLLDYNDHFPELREIGLILSVKRKTKRAPRQSECVILFGERKLKFAGYYWEAFKRIEKMENK